MSENTETPDWRERFRQTIKETTQKMKKERKYRNLFLYKENNFFEFDKFFKENFEYSDELTLTSQRTMIVCWAKHRLKHKIGIIHFPIQRLRELFKNEKVGSVYYFYCKIKDEYKLSQKNTIKNVHIEQIKEAQKSIIEKAHISQIPVVRIQDTHVVKRILKMQLISCKKENKMHILMQQKDYITCDLSDLFANGATEDEKIENSLASIRALRKR